MDEINEKKAGPEKKVSGGWLYLGCAVLAVLLEVFVFQYHFWNSSRLTTIRVPLEAVYYQGDYGFAEDGSLIMQEENGQNLLQLDLRGLTEPVKNIEIKAVCTDGHEEWMNRSREVYAILDSNAVWARTVQTTVEDNILLADKMLGAGQEDVVWFASGRNPEVVTVLLSGVKGHVIRISGITLNAHPSFRFHIGRFCVVLLGMLFLISFRPGSRLWKQPAFTEKKALQPSLRAGICAVFAVLAVMIPQLIRQNPVYMQSEGGFPFYRQLAHALADGHTYIDLQPSQELLAMEDPYDPAARLEQGVPFYLDYAYYQEKYYVYFGIIPCLLLYLPLYLIAGIDVPGWIVLSILLFLVSLGQFVLLKKLCERYAPAVSQAAFVLLWLAGTAAMSLPQAMGDACNYYIPMLSAVVLFQFGYAGCIAAVQRMEAGKKANLLLAVSSLMLAAIAGCRPQMVLGAAAVLPLLWPHLFGKKDGKAGNIRNLLCFGLPFIVTAAGLMAYNMARFGSVMEFGTKYNLTFAYVNIGGVYREGIGNGLYYYLLRPFQLMDSYPYLQRTNLEWSNPAGLASHPSVGGLYLLYPVLMLGFGSFAGKKEGERTEKYGEMTYIGYISLALVMLLPVLDAVMGGLMDRYKLDFVVFASLAMSIGVLMLSQGMKEKHRGFARGILVLLTVGALFLSGLSYGMEGVSSLLQVNPEGYAAISQALEFWR